MNPFSTLFIFLFGIASLQAFEEDDLFCESFREARDSFLVKSDSAVIAEALSEADSSADTGNCEAALDIMIELEVSLTEDAEDTADKTREELNDLDSALNLAIDEIEKDIKDTIENLSEKRSFENSVSMLGDYYSSDEESYEFSDELGDTLELQESRVLSYGIEHEFITRNTESFLRYFRHRLSMLNEYFYEQLENEMGWDLFNNNIGAGLHSYLNVKRHHLDDSTSFANLILKPEFKLRTSSSYSAGIYGSGELKGYKLQKSGYENYRKTSVGGDFSWLGESFDLDLELYLTEKSFTDSSHQNYSLSVISISPGYYFNKNINAELYLSRENLLYINNPLGPDREITQSTELTLNFLPHKSADIYVPLTYERIKYTQYDSISEAYSGDNIFKTDYNSVRAGVSPSLIYNFTESTGIEGSVSFERMRVNVSEDQWEDPLMSSQYFIPREDNYNRSGWSFSGNYQRELLRSEAGLGYEVVRYQSDAQLDNADYKSLRVMADLSIPLYKKLTFLFDLDWPFPGFLDENSVTDKSFSFELEYKL